MRRFLKIHVPIFALLLLLFYLFYALDITCPILFLTGIPCPTCGCTRALASLLVGDIEAYLDYQPFAPVLLLSVLLMLHQRFFSKRPLYAFVFSVLILNTAYYAYRLTA